VSCLPAAPEMQGSLPGPSCLRLSWISDCEIRMQTVMGSALRASAAAIARAAFCAIADRRPRCEPIIDTGRVRIFHYA